MTHLLYVLSFITISASPITLSGTVVDGEGHPVPDAQVFMEQGIEAPLQTTVTDEAGQFVFPARAEVTGLFARADGTAFGGRTVNPAEGETLSGLTIQLAAAGEVHARIVDSRGKPVSGALITRVVLLGDDKVGIPLTKLTDYGVPLPTSDDKGAVSVSMLPQGGKVALKVTHPLFAQEGVDGVAVGTDNLKVELSPGVIVQGKVLSRTEKLPVAGAALEIWKAQPPHDTTLAKSDRSGTFIVRLKPGVYRYQAETDGYRTPGWQPLTVTGETAAQDVAVYLAGLGTVTGTVKDAVSGKPVSGARFVLEVKGNTAARVVTGPEGTFSLKAVEGENILHIEGAPGYLPPETRALKANVVAGKSLDLPPFWLAPLPTFTVQVVDENMTPVTRAAVTVLEPGQLGSWFTDEQGNTTIRLQSPPPAGRLVGMATDPTGARGALFAVEGTHKGVAQVQVMPLGTVHGQVALPDGSPVSGALVSAWAATSGDPVLVWRTLSSADGAFSWPAALPLTPAKCLVQVADGTPRVESKTFRIEPGTTEDLGVITVPSPGVGTSMAGQSIAWRSLKHLAGPTIPDSEPARPTLLLYAKSDEAQAVAEGVDALAELPATRGWNMVLIVPGAYPDTTAPVPVLQGNAPGSATTYLLQANGNVAIETFGLPTVSLFRSVKQKVTSTQYGSNPQ